MSRGGPAGSDPRRGLVDKAANRPSSGGTVRRWAIGGFVNQAPTGVRTGRSPSAHSKNKRGRTRGSRSCLWVVEEGLLGWVLHGEARFDDVHGSPVAAEVLRDPGRELESNPQAAVLEEDVRVLELGHVQRDALPLLRQGTLRASDETGTLERMDPPVAGGDWDAVLAAQVDRGLRLLERRDENLCRVLVRHESRRFKGVHRHILLVWRNRRDGHY